MADSLIFDMPMELGLEFVAIISSHLSDSKGELSDDVVDKSDRVGLSMTIVDLQRADTGRIIDGRVLVTPDGFAAFPLEGQELDVDLDLVARNLLFVAFGVDFSDAGSTRKFAQSMPPENPIDPCIRDFDVVVAGEIPDDPDRTEMIGLPQMQNLLDDL